MFLLELFLIFLDIIFYFTIRYLHKAIRNRAIRYSNVLDIYLIGLLVIFLFSILEGNTQACTDKPQIYFTLSVVYIGFFFLLPLFVHSRVHCLKLRNELGKLSLGEVSFFILELRILSIVWYSSNHTYDLVFPYANTQFLKLLVYDTALYRLLPQRIYDISLTNTTAHIAHSIFHLRREIHIGNIITIHTPYDQLVRGCCTAKYA